MTAHIVTLRNEGSNDILNRHDEFRGGFFIPPSMKIHSLTIDFHGKNIFNHEKTYFKY